MKDPYILNDNDKISEYVLSDVVFEKIRQIDKWGLQSHSMADWLAILGEEVGECSKAYLEYKFNNDRTGSLYKELIQVATVALNIADAIGTSIKKENER